MTSDQTDVEAQSEELANLAQVDPRLIQELFDKDPLALTDQDLDVIIAEFRKDRANYIQESSTPKAKKTSAKKEAVIPLGQIDLADLGLI